MFACWGCWGGVCVAFSCIADQSLRSSYQPMNILAQHLTATVVMTSAALIKKKMPPALHYLWWQIAFSGGAYGARTQHHTIRILCLRQVTLHWNTPPGMVMLSTTGVTSTPSGMVMLLIPRVTLTPLSDGKDTLEKCYSTLRQVGMHGSLCIANLST